MHHALGSLVNKREGMTTTSAPTALLAPPLSRSARIAAGLCLCAASLSNGLSQYVGELFKPDSLEDFSAQIRWGVEHPAIHAIEQTALLVSMLFLPLGFLALAHVTRWSSPRLTGAAVVLLLWGMWGFHNVVALGYAAGTVAINPLGTDSAVALNDGYTEHSGVLLTALLPHLLGSFLGLLLLAAAGLRGRSLPRPALLMLVAFLIWDFLLPSAGPLEPHLLLTVSLAWLGVHVLRMPQSVWLNPRLNRVSG